MTTPEYNPFNITGHAKASHEKQTNDTVKEFDEHQASIVR